MSARVLNPAMMTEVGRNLGGARASPSRAALARVRRDLFGPVDHAAARALAEKELRAQSILDAERWGFDFRLEIPKDNDRYEWETISSQEVVPEPYALRGMPYLRKHAPATPRKHASPRTVRQESRSFISSTPIANFSENAERTPPQEPRVPDIGDTTLEEVTHVTTITEICYKNECIKEPITPTLSTTSRKQSSITDFMKSRKRTINGITKSMVEPPEKVARNAGQIRS
ncbi:uncharacterized protein LOC127284446 [Leptopilina boulardi]|uniref:uncharacterized protein LOC127284446 n=1 Tax=Leptopilina boulardi TaxID=63433 RepID=UPI0021F5928E|nr:uncharacterized protein LOC127284446 [Leptopilina boulardi]